ncbi:MAG: DNA polymerase I [Saprospiraceae bacterium]
MIDPKTDKRLFLLDGHALVYRAHYAFIARPLFNSKGQNVSAINGFVRTLWDLITNQKPTHIAVSFDLPGPTFRHEMYEPYKANRDAQPEDISFALPWIKKIIEALNIPVITKVGFEADDVIGTIAKQAEKEGYVVYMVTPDKDYGQLVSDKIFMYKPGRQGNEVEICGVPEILATWDIEHVDQVIDMLGLQGDSVDNIPGIPGIGPKSAAILLKAFGSMENIIASVDQLKGKQQENVRNFAEQGMLSKRLARIDIEVPIQFNETDYCLDPPDKVALRGIFDELEFRTLARSILGTEAVPVQQSLFDTGAPRPLPGMPDENEQFSETAPVVRDNITTIEHKYLIADTVELREQLLKELMSQAAVAYDSETTDVDANLAELVGMSFSWGKSSGWYMPLPADRNECLAIIEAFRPFFESESIKKIGQNLKYDALILKWYGIEVNGPYFDTMLAHYLLEPELRHNMDYLAEIYLNYSPVSISTLIGKKGVTQGTMRDVELDKIAEYATEDADITWQLAEVLSPKLLDHEVATLNDNLEAPLVKVLTDLEFEGINIDAQYLKNYSKELMVLIATAEEKVYEMAGARFNIGSPKQVGEVLFDVLKIPYRWKKTSSGQYSTDEDKLSELAYENPVASAILTFRGLSKLLSTYVDALPKMINPKSGRIHSSFNQALAATGRLSSNNPNLQNIPIKTPEGARVREAFIPRDENHVLLSADYSQIELRLIAEMSGDEAMLDAFIKGLDIHLATAAKVYGVPLEEVTPTQRRNAKTVNFSIIYGAGSTNLSKQLGIKRQEAKELIEAYFTQYHGLKKYMDETVKFARDNGYVITLMGRKRNLRDINSRNDLARSGAERVAVNTPIQGTAADMIKAAMIQIHKEFKEHNFASKMVLQVHDELVFDVLKSELEMVKPIIENGMKYAMPNLKVPILVGMGIGNNWLEAH